MFVGPWNTRGTGGRGHIQRTHPWPACLLVCLFVCLSVRVIHEVLEAEATSKEPIPGQCVCVFASVVVCLSVCVIHEVLEAEAMPKNPFLVSVFASVVVCLSVCVIHEVLEAEAMPKNPFLSVCSQEEGSELYPWFRLAFFCSLCKSFCRRLVNAFLVSVSKIYPCFR